MLNLRRSFLIILLTLSVVAVGCDSGGVDDEPEEASAVFVANQGNFGDGNGSVSTYDPATDMAQPAAVPPAQLGSTVQGAFLTEERYYVVANTGRRLDVFDRETLQRVGQTDMLFANPRYVLVEGETAYVTDQVFGGTSSVAVLDLSGEAIALRERIEVSGSPEGLARAGDRLFVGLGAFDASDRVAIIDAEQGALIEEVDIGCSARFVLADRQGEVFALCTDTGEAVILDGLSGDELARLDLGGAVSTNGPGQDGYYTSETEELYAVVGQNTVVRINTANNAVAGTVGPLSGTPISAVAYDAERQTLYLGRTEPAPAGFTERGTVTLHRRDGEQTGRFETGIAPTYISPASE